MKHPFLSSVCGAALLAASTMSWAAGPQLATGHAHVHGVAQLDVALEPQQLTLSLEVPLDNLLGFERAPRTAAERQRAEAAVNTLKAADSLFVIDPAAGCKLKSVELESAALKLGAAGQGAAAGDGHAELEATVQFDCQNTALARHIDIGLFKAFSRMQRIEVQGVTPKGQFKRGLTRSAPRLLLTPAR